MLLPVIACAGWLVPAIPAAEAPLSYNRDVRPILSDNCFLCHGPDKNHRKGKMRLDIREEALIKEAFVPGQPEKSELVKRIFTAKDEDRMPPPESHKTLSAEQKSTLSRWIGEGAKYEPHWAYLPPVRAAVPAILGLKSKAANPIDAFILAELSLRQIQPSPAADRPTLLRRLSLDLTGLPPTPEEVAAFVKDKSANAYEKQVDRLLASPHFGERMAVPWLDVVRFTDTVGYHGDQNANVFPYRDYVINAFNENKPFDRFTVEQLAGDLLPNNTVEQRIATGFNRLNMVTREGGAQPREYLAKYGADRARTVGMAWMGISVGCAECHDHKFDPFTTRDFYSLKAYFADVKQWGVYSDYKYTPNPDLKNWSNEHPFPPEEVVESLPLKRRILKLHQQLSELAGAAWKQPGDHQRAEFDAWKKETTRLLKHSPDGWLRLEPVPVAFTNLSVITNKTKLTNLIAGVGGKATVTNINSRLAFKTNAAVFTNFAVTTDGSMLFDKKSMESKPLSLKLTNGWITSLRLEALPHEKHGSNIFRGNNKSATVHLSASIKRAGEKKETKLDFYHADADHKEPRYDNGFEVIDIKDSWKLDRNLAQQKQTGVWLLNPPLQVKDGDLLILSIKSNLLGCIRASVSPLAANPALVAASRQGTSNPPPLVTPKEMTALARDPAPLTWLASLARDTNAFAEYKKLQRSILECRGGKSPTLVTVSWKPDITRVLPRGNWQSDSGEIVEPQPPHFLPQPKREGTIRLTRLDLANWIVSPDNPLTARVVVNRLWKQFFGNGLANPVDDFGSQGEPPSHPELLDWLATEFMTPTVAASRTEAVDQNGRALRRRGYNAHWDVKHIVRLMVTSATYRQSASLRPELREIDPNNRLLASQNPRRLEAEFVRDNALLIAGLLNLDLGGPSAQPYQPAGYYANLQFPDRDYLASKDDRQYRRGLYSHWQRTFLHPMLANFDAPAREECTAARNVSNTPQQALTLLNDPTFVEAARVWAAKLLHAKARTDNVRLELAFQQALGRSIKPKELESLMTFLDAQRRHLAEDTTEAPQLQKIGRTPSPKDLEAAELGVWSSLCRVLLNLHETITRY